MAIFFEIIFVRKEYFHDFRSVFLAYIHDSFIKQTIYIIYGIRFWSNQTIKNTLSIQSQYVSQMLKGIAIIVINKKKEENIHMYAKYVVDWV